MDVKVDWWTGWIGRGGLGGWAGRWSRGLLGEGAPRVREYRQEERGFEPELGLGLDLTWLARVRQKVSVVLYSCMVQRSECLVLCARGAAEAVRSRWFVSDGKAWGPRRPRAGDWDWEPGAASLGGGGGAGRGAGLAGAGLIPRGPGLLWQMPF